MIPQTMSEALIQAINAILKRGNRAEIAIEHGQPVVIEIRRKKVNT